MTDQTPPPPSAPDPTSAATPPPPPTYAAPPAVAPAYGAPAQMGPGPIGKVRSTGMCFLLTIVTLGIYCFFWYFNTASETKRHTGRGLGGGVSLLLAIFVSVVMPFFSASEVGTMQEMAGRPKTVSGVTGLWILLPLVGSIVWFVKVNGALNEYWKSLGATA